MIKEVDVAPAFDYLPGDKFAPVSVGSEVVSVLQKRAGAVVALRTGAQVTGAQLTEQVQLGSFKISRLFLEVSAVVSVAVTSVEFNVGGTITVNYSDGDSVEYGDRDAISAAADTASNAAGAKKLLLARWKGRNPALDDPGQINGTAVDVNMESVQQPVTFGEV